MASLLSQLSLLFLLFLASSLLIGVHARESRYFMKATRPEDSKETTATPEETAVPALPPLQSLRGSGYGLYGHGQEQFSQATTNEYNNNKNYYNNNNNNNNARPGAELAGENYENNKEYNGGYNYAKQFKYANNRFSNEEFGSRSDESKEYNNYVDPSKQYGMSDTRFLDNGKYYYDVDAGRKRNRYETYPTRGYPETGTRGGNYGKGVYGNGNGNGYQYGNAMEGYQNNQVNQESQEEDDGYVP